MPEICYVCERPIRDNPLYIGKGKYRHPSRCRPLTKNWEEYTKRNRKESAKLLGEQSIADIENEFKHDARRDLSKEESVLVNEN